MSFIPQHKWTDYTPAIPAGFTNLGSGSTHIAQFRRTASGVDVHQKIIIGTSPTLESLPTQIELYLPPNMTVGGTENFYVGMIFALEVGPNNYFSMHAGVTPGNTWVYGRPDRVSGTPTGLFENDNPFTFGAGDHIYLTAQAIPIVEFGG